MYPILGSVTLCPGIFKVEVFLANPESRIAEYDMLVDCPHNFSTSFEVRLKSVQLVDIFIVVINDTSTSHRLVLSSVQGPQLFMSSGDGHIVKTIEEASPWMFLVVILAVCMTVSLFLLMFYVYCDKQPKAQMSDLPVPKPDLGPQITLLQHIDKYHEKKISMKTKCVMVVLVILYITYACVFTFTALFGLFHIIQGSSIHEIKIATNASSRIQHILETNLNNIIEEENIIMGKMLQETKDRLSACGNHLQLTLNNSDSKNINSALSRILSDMYKPTGSISSGLRAYFAKQTEVYEAEVQKFYREYNKTLHISLNKLQTTYASYLKSVAENKWFNFPREKFMEQQLLRGRFFIR